MTNAHPPEMELQQFVLDESACSRDTIAHIDACEHCQSNVAAYRLLFAGIKEQPKPVFDFDVSALVLSKIKAPEALSVADRSFSPLSSIIIFLSAGIPLYLFRKNINYMFTGLSPLFIYIMAAAGLLIILFNVQAMYKKYQGQMKALRFH